MISESIYSESLILSPFLFSEGNQGLFPKELSINLKKFQIIFYYFQLLTSILTHPTHDYTTIASMPRKSQKSMIALV